MYELKIFCLLSSQKTKNSVQKWVAQLCS